MEQALKNAICFAFFLDACSAAAISHLAECDSEAGEKRWRGVL